MATNNPEPENVVLTHTYNGERPNFRRDQFGTLYEMSKVINNIDEGHISFCLEDKKTYQFLSSNEIDETTGRWRPFTTGGNSHPSNGSIVFLNNVDEYKALPEEEKRKSNCLYVIGKKD